MPAVSFFMRLFFAGYDRMIFLTAAYTLGIGGDHIKIQWKILFIAIAIPLAVGALSALLTRESMTTFDLLVKPPLSPPPWLFPVVWTILYTLMGAASCLVFVSEEASMEEIRQALSVYALQLFFNFFWSILFFHFEAYLLSFVWLCILLFLILLTALQFFRINKTSGYLLVPYIIWVTFAGYLNLTIYLLN